MFIVCAPYFRYKALEEKNRVYKAKIDRSNCNNSINLQYSNPLLNGTIGREYV